MTVKEAIQALSQLPESAVLMVASRGHGGSVPLQGFEDVDHVRYQGKPEMTHWIDVVFCDDEDRGRHGLHVGQTVKLS